MDSNTHTCVATIITPNPWRLLRVKARSQSLAISVDGDEETGKRKMVALGGA